MTKSKPPKNRCYLTLNTTNTNPSEDCEIIIQFLLKYTLIELFDLLFLAILGTSILVDENLSVVFKLLIHFFHSSHRFIFFFCI